MKTGSMGPSHVGEVAFRSTEGFAFHCMLFYKTNLRENYPIKKKYLIFKKWMWPPACWHVYVYLSVVYVTFSFVLSLRRKRRAGGSDRNKTSSVCLFGEAFFFGGGEVVGVIWLDKK